MAEPRAPAVADNPDRLSPDNENMATDPALMAPLAGFAGARPRAPGWFDAAIDAPHQRHRTPVDGAAIEWLSWGDRGLPGLMLFHGNGANADWWRHVAPFLAATHHVVAPSWSGMGASTHRNRYSVAQYVGEALAVADAAGFAGRFAVAGHSFGGFPALRLAARHGARIGQAIIIDTPLGGGKGPPRSDNPRPHKIYATLTQALARFRWAPLQPTPNPFIADFFARAGLMAVDGGWTWRFDPCLWHRFDHARDFDTAAMLAAIRVPLSYVWGEQSVLAEAGMVSRIRALMPPGTRLVGIPDAHHHLMADQPLALVAVMRALLAP